VQNQAMEIRNSKVLTGSDNADGDGLPSLAWAGVATIALVWYVGASSLPQGLAWVDEHLVLNISAAVFLFASLLLNIPRKGRWKLAVLLVQAVSAAAFIAVDVSSSGPILNIVLVAQLPYILGIRTAVAAAVVVNLAHVFLQMVFHENSALGAFLSTALFMCFQVFSLFIGYYAIQAREARKSLEMTNSELLATRSLLESSARDRERLRVTRELHDTAGHMLTALKLNLRQLRDRSGGEDRVALEECLKLSADLLEDIRALVGNLREHDPIDVTHALTELTRPFSQPEFIIEVDPEMTISELPIAESLLAVAREAITNVVRHAGASQCTITVRRDDGQLQLSVVDDGRGAPGHAEGFGIGGMRERMQGPGKTLEISPNEPSGTRVSALWANA